MKALITGASSGLGRDLAKILSNMGYDLILVARRTERLQDLKDILTTQIEIKTLDLSDYQNCIKLYDEVKEQQIDILINNAGFGLLGRFSKTSLDREMQMIDVNIKAVHILTKLFLRDFMNRDSGYILNISSSASFFSGPLMSTYYATKNYVTILTEAIHKELQVVKSNVYIGVFCPGPIATEFNQVAQVKEDLKSLNSEKAANYAIRKMFRRKFLIIPGFLNKCLYLFRNLIPNALLLTITYQIQKKKEGKK